MTKPVTLLFTALWTVIVTGFANENRLRRWAKPISSHRFWPVIAQQVRDSAVNSNRTVPAGEDIVWRFLTEYGKIKAEVLQNLVTNNGGYYGRDTFN